MLPCRSSHCFEGYALGNPLHGNTSMLSCVVLPARSSCSSSSPSGSASEKALCPHLPPPLPAHGFPELCSFFCVCQDRGSGTVGGRTGERIFCSVKWQLLSGREELLCRILVGKYVGFLSQWTNSGTHSRCLRKCVHMATSLK